MHSAVIRIRRTRAVLEREPLARPLGFKGARMSAIWQAVAGLWPDDGGPGVGLASQSPLWCDRRVFLARGEEGANAVQFAVLREALAVAHGRSFTSPLELLDEILPHVARRARVLTGLDDLAPTFALTALVALDHAAWQLYARGFPTLDAAIPPGLRAPLAHRAARIGAIPLLGYDAPLEEVRRLATAGYPLLKLKIGSDPEGDGDPDKMLRWDMGRLEAVHRETGGRLPYYLDANGRYDGPDRLARLLDHARRIGAYERIVLLEEPFPEALKIPVGGFGVRIAADESAHSVEDVRERIALGYGAIALKPAAKTFSLTLRMAAAAHAAGVPCFVADLTVTPILVDWNKSVAARLAPLPGLGLPAFETNGAQHYARWTELQSFHPRAGESWTAERAGGFDLDEAFYVSGGGALAPAPRYLGLLRPER